MKYILIFILILTSKMAMSDFFKNITNLIENNTDRLSYGVSVADINNDSKFEFIVAGFRYPNLALGFRDGVLKNLINNSIFSDQKRSTIGVASCDIDQDGMEETYFLNTDTYSGEKKYSDRLLNFNKEITDLFELPKNQKNLNLTAGRSVVCVDRKGDGKYGFYVANYGGPTRFYELNNDLIRDIAPDLKIDKITGGRAVVAGHILGNKMDIFAANERGPNFLYFNDKDQFYNVSTEYNTDDVLQNGRGTTLSDFLYRGSLDIINGNWEGFHRIFVNNETTFNDMASKDFRVPSRIRTIISADFDNDGYDEIFMNNIGEPNKLFKILENGKITQIKISNALEKNGLGTGAAVADIDNDGILELLISHGESGPQPLSLFKSNIKNKKFLRIAPKTTYGAPARGATVILVTNKRRHAKTIDAGSGYLCQMEPVAHYGFRKNEIIKNVIIKWTDGSINEYKVNDLNKTYVFRKGL
ncbi:MAG: hypothetical protein CM15mP67_08100 [Alphaproteobacteria bacterium]|nr:MAG: hypothetical protein CM15mP67_08100 [Alphaproteobacteria bacterium]